MINIAYPEGATPLDPDEIAGLQLPHITTHQELDRWEQENIHEAQRWLENRRSTDILTEKFLRQLHNKMFHNVWTWAGKYRTSKKNIGVICYHILPEVKKLCDDVGVWIENKSYSYDEIAARLL